MPIVQHSPWDPKTSTADLQDRLDSHKSDTDAQQLHAQLKQSYKDLIAKINENITDTREKALALTQLEDSFMWLGKAIFLPDRSPAVSGESTVTETPKKNDTVYFDGMKSKYFEDWFGQDFVGWANENVPGQVKDKILLQFLNNRTTVSVSRGTFIRRIARGTYTVLYND